MNAVSTNQPTNQPRFIDKNISISLASRKIIYYSLLSVNELHHLVFFSAVIAYIVIWWAFLMQNLLQHKGGFFWSLIFDIITLFTRFTLNRMIIDVAKNLALYFLFFQLDPPPKKKYFNNLVSCRKSARSCLIYWRLNSPPILQKCFAQAISESIKRI